MTEEESLLRAVRLFPKEDTPRLVYADWLQENGREERAEFIRVQVELAGDPGPECLTVGGIHIPGDHARCDGGICVECRKLPGKCPYHALRDRERELLRPDEKAEPGGWHEPIPLNGTISWEFRRGFVQSVTCTAHDWLRHGDAILSRHPVTLVRLTTYPDTTLLYKLNGGESPGNVISHHEAILGRRWPGVEFVVPHIPTFAVDSPGGAAGG